MNVSVIVQGIVRLHKTCTFVILKLSWRFVIFSGDTVLNQSKLDFGNIVLKMMLFVKTTSILVVAWVRRWRWSNSYKGSVSL